MMDDVTGRIARRVAALRAERGLSLEALAARSGVSRSMISLVERAESSPTAAVLERLAAGLGVSLAALFEAAPEAPRPVARRAEQAVWRDPESGYLRRNLSPSGFPSPVELVEVEFPAGGRVTLEGGRREPALHQQLWILDGALELTRGGKTERLEKGDCLAMEMAGPTVFHNPGRRPVRYVVAIAGEGPRAARR